MDSLALKAFALTIVLMALAPLVAGSLSSKFRCDDWEDWD